MYNKTHQMAQLGGKIIILSASSYDVESLALFAASSLIDFCDNNLPDPELRACSGPSRCLANYMTEWADHGILNAAQSQASLIYDTIVFKLENPNSIILQNRNKRLLLTNALSHYQTWKTQYIKKDQEYHHNPNWGSATGFNQMDWADQNQKLLDLP